MCDEGLHYIFELLEAPSVYDATALWKLEVLFNAFQHNDFALLQTGPYNYIRIPDGKYHNP